jgi:hypothetical protein
MDDRLTKRVDAIERELARRDEQPNAVIDESGRQWRFRDFLNIGLTRRQAMSVVASLAAGATLGAALSDAVVAQPTGDEGQVGTQANPVEVWASEIDASEAATAEAWITNTTNVKTHLESSIVLTDGGFTALDMTTAQVTGPGGNTMTGWDNLGEWDDTNHKFIPDNSGKYFVSFQASVEAGTEVVLEFEDFSDSEKKKLEAQQGPASNDRDQYAGVSGLVDLVGGNDHLLQARVRDSPDGDAEITNGPHRTYLDIWRFPLQV